MADLDYPRRKASCVDATKARHWARPRGCAFADTFAILTYYTLVGGLNEYFVAGLSETEVLSARLAAIPILIATGAIYGSWRDFVRASTQFYIRSRFEKLLIETTLCLVFRTPVYALILKCGGAEGEAFWRGMIGGIVIILVSARPCGIWIDYVRRCRAWQFASQ